MIQKKDAKKTVKHLIPLFVGNYVNCNKCLKKFKICSIFKGVEFDPFEIWIFLFLFKKRTSWKCSKKGYPTYNDKPMIA